MTPEEWERIERKIEFLVDQQADFFTQVQAVRELSDRNAELIQRNSEQIQRNSEQIQRNSEQIGRHAEQIGELSSNMVQLTEILQTLTTTVGDGFNRVFEAQKRTEDKLNVVIDVLDRHFSDGDG